MLVAILETEVELTTTSEEAEEVTTGVVRMATSTIAAIEEA